VSWALWKPHLDDCWIAAEVGASIWVPPLHWSPAKPELSSSSVSQTRLSPPWCR